MNISRIKSLDPSKDYSGVISLQESGSFLPSAKLKLIDRMPNDSDPIRLRNVDRAA